jgi:hypothetical protein
MGALILVAESNGPTMFAQIAASSACSIPTGKTIIGARGSWREIANPLTQPGQIDWNSSSLGVSSHEG